MDNSRAQKAEIPGWLSTDENYSPPSDRDAFINKSILSLLRVLSRIKTQDTRVSDKSHVNAMFKVSLTFLLIILLSLSGSFMFVIVVIVYLLAAVSIMEGKTIVSILKVSLGMALFTFIVMLPAAFWGSPYSAVMITCKVFAAITAANILSRSTKWSAVTNACKRFFLPDIFILVLDITIKYILLLGDFALSMLYALKVRSVGRNKSKHAAMSGVAGTMFIKSKEMAEEMYSAMECRGFSGEYRVHSGFRFTIADFAYITVNIGIFLIFLYFGRT